MQKVIITGASGFLGYHLYSELPENIQPVGLYHRTKPLYTKFAAIAADLCNYENTTQLLRTINPDAIIHTAAISDSNYCESNPAESYAINVAATKLLSDYATQHNIPFLFTSTDMVFDGKKGNYIETDLPNPIMIYGNQKWEAEKYIVANNSTAIIARLPLMIGQLQASKKNYLSQAIEKLKKNESIFLFEDEYRSIADANSVAKNCWRLLFREKGIFHLGGNERLSRLAFGQMVQQIFGFNKQLFIAKKQQEMQFAAPRPADASMCNLKAKSIGCTFDDIYTALLKISQQ